MGFGSTLSRWHVLGLANAWLVPRLRDGDKTDLELDHDDADIELDNLQEASTFQGNLKPKFT